MQSFRPTAGSIIAVVVIMRSSGDRLTKVIDGAALAWDQMFAIPSANHCMLNLYSSGYIKVRLPINWQSNCTDRLEFSGRSVRLSPKSCGLL